MRINPQNGAPAGYDQQQPFNSAPKLPPGQASAPAPQQSPLQASVLGPSNYQPDPSMQQWVNRQPGKQPMIRPVQPNDPWNIEPGGFTGMGPQTPPGATGAPGQVYGSGPYAGMPTTGNWDSGTMHQRTYDMGSGGDPSTGGVGAPTSDPQGALMRANPVPGSGPVMLSGTRYANGMVSPGSQMGSISAPVPFTAGGPGDHSPGLAPMPNVPNGGLSNQTSANMSGAAAPSFGNLTDPSQWMNLVGNKDQLESWEHSVSPKLSQHMLDYYAGKIAGQPGANPTEQAGSADYWAKKMLNDPTVTGRPQQQTPLSSSVSGLPQFSSLPSYLAPFLQQLMQQANQRQ